MPISYSSSIIFLWIIALVLVLAVTRLYRQEIAKMVRLQGHDRGMAIGEQFPLSSISDINGTPIELNSPRNKGTVIVFTSLTCHACKSVYPFLSGYQDKHPDIRVVSLIVGDKSEIVEKIAEYKLTIPVAPLEQEEMRKLGVSSIPFSYFLSASGKIAAKGLINNEQHLDTLIATSQFTPYMQAG